MPAPQESSQIRLPFEPLRLALWFGMAAGLAEGTAFLIFQELGWLGWERQIVPVDLNILWASTLMSGLLFVLASFPLIALAYLLRKLPWESLLAGFFATTGFYGVIAITGHMSERASLFLAIGLGVAVARVVTGKRAASMEFFRRSMIPLSVVTALVCAVALAWHPVRERMEIRALPAPPSNAPSVLWIVLDTVRADRLGAYGYPRPTTPFLDRLAKQSVLFEAAFSNSSWTLASHGSMFSGLRPHEHGVVLFPKEIPSRLIAEEMASRGYLTAGFASNNGALSRGFGLARGFQRWENMFVLPVETASRTTWGRKIRKFLLRGFEFHPHLLHMGAPEINRRFLNWLEAKPGRSFFVYLNYMEAHRRYAPPYEYAKRFSSRPERITPPHEPWINREVHPKSFEEEVELMGDAYDAVLAYLDSQVEELFRELEKRNLHQNLLVIVTSDHGESFGEHGLFIHRNSLYRDQIHVPLLIRLPGKTPDGVRIQEAVGLERLPATILDLLGMENKVFPNQPLSAHWSASPPRDTKAFAELTGGKWPGVPQHWPIYQGNLQSVITSRWHLIVSENGPHELYDWRDDPREEKNLAQLPEYAKVMAELLPLLTAPR